MPTYEIKGPDGKTYEIDGPEGATRAQVIEAIKARGGMGGASEGNAAPAPRESKDRSLLEYVGDLGSTAFQGVTAGFGDEIAAGVSAPVGAAIDYFAGDGSFDLGKNYDEALGRERGKLKEFSKDNPAAAIAAEVGGGVLTGGMGLAKLGAAKAGAVAGGLYGFGTGEGGIENRGINAGIGTVTGAAGGKFADKLFKGVQSLFTKKTGKALVPVRPGVKPSAAQTAVNEADEFGVRLTKGQALDDFAQRSFEDAGSKGGRGTGPTEVLRPFFKEQRESVISAGKGLGGAQFGSVNEAGTAAADSVKGAARALRQEVDDAYEAARGFNARLSAEQVPALTETMKGTINSGIRDLLESGAEDAAKLYPGTKTAMRLADGLVKEVQRTDQTGAWVVSKVHFKRFEEFRKTINELIDAAGSKADRKNLLKIKGSFDGWMDGAVDNALFTGDDAFLEAYKGARALRAAYGKRFEGGKNNVGGQALKRIIETDANEVQTINYILGASNQFGGAKIAPAVKTMKKALGANSEGFQALREAAVMRLMEGAEKTGKERLGAQSLWKVWHEALNGKGAPVMRELFDKNELAKMKRFTGMVRRIVPAEGSVNTSASALEMARKAAEGVGQVLGMPRNVINHMTGLLPDSATLRARGAVNPGAVVSAVRAKAPSGGRAATAGALGGNVALDDALGRR